MKKGLIFVGLIAFMIIAVAAVWTPPINPVRVVSHALYEDSVSSRTKLATMQFVRDSGGGISDWELLHDSFPKWRDMADSMAAAGAALPYDSSSVAANSHLLQGKDTTYIFNKVVAGSDTHAVHHNDKADSTSNIHVETLFVYGVVCIKDGDTLRSLPYVPLDSKACSTGYWFWIDSARAKNWYGNLNGTLEGKDTTALFNAKTLQGKDTTALFNAKTLQGKDTTALFNAKNLQGKDTSALWRVGGFLVGDTVMVRTTGGAPFAASARFTSYVDSCAGVDSGNLAARSYPGARARVLTLRDSVFVKNGATVITVLTVSGKWVDLEYLGPPCNRWWVFGSN